MESSAILKGITAVTSPWTKQKRKEERAASARRFRKSYYSAAATTIKDAAFMVMEQAYLKASAGGTLPAHARQIMYAARPYILEKTGKQHLRDEYFTQVLLPEYIRENELTWDVVYDARGHFQEPHALRGEEVALGTLDVRRYLHETRSHTVDPPSTLIGGQGRYPTCGPQHRFGAILFIEKEGFMPLFEKVELAARFDVAIMSTKGFSNVASRYLIDELCGGHDIPLLVLHDFDVSGFGILETLRYGTDRYEVRHDITVIDIGLRLDDVKEYQLEGEPVHHRRSFSTLAMTEEEAEYLHHERVELNALASDQLVELVESKLRMHDVAKVVPDADTLKQAYRRAIHMERLHIAMQHATVDAEATANSARVPAAIGRKVKAMLADYPELSWDEAIRRIVKSEQSTKGK